MAQPNTKRTKRTMNRNRNPIFWITLIIIASVMSLLSASAAMAQTEDVESLETTLARSTAQSFLTTLTRPELSDTMSFYLLDAIETDALLAELQTPPVTAFTITEAEWISSVTYQVKATLQPGNRDVSVYVGEYNSRWQVEGIDLPIAPEPATTPTTTTAAAPAATSGPAPVTGNGEGIIAFMTRSGGDIYTINADGTNLQWVTSGGLDPQLSPDGTQIAYTRWEPRYELFTINVDGTNEQAWTHGWRKMKSPTWAADGSRLVFSYQDGGRLEPDHHHIELREAAIDGDTIDIPPDARGVEIENGILEYTIPADAYWFLREIDLATYQMEQLITERHAYGPTGHPNDANLIIYKGNHGIALNNRYEGRDYPVSTDFRDHTPVISPDGSKVAVAYQQDGHWEIHLMNLDGSHRQRLTKTPISVIADNTRLVTATVAGKERIVAPENPNWNNAAPVWSPDGTQIAFITDRTGAWEFWIMNADGSNQRPLFSNGALDGIDLNYAGVDERMLSWVIPSN